MAAAEDLLDVTLRDFLERLASREPAPAAGSVAALTVAMAAAVLTKAARASAEIWTEARGVVAQAEALRNRVAPLAQLDAEAYAQAQQALQKPEDTELRRTMTRAADIPLRIAEVAADVAALGTVVAEHGDPATRADAVAAAMLAEAGAHAASELVAVNLLSLPEDERVLRARELERAAAESAERAAAAHE